MTPVDVTSVASRLGEHQSRTDAGFTESTGTLRIGSDELLYVMTAPEGPFRSTGIVMSPSYFELSMLQSAEIEFARRSAASGFACIYVQPPGAGDSTGDPLTTTFSDRIAAALAGAAELRPRSGSTDRVRFFGPRAGGLVALLAAQELEGAGAVVWDPALDGDVYWNQVRRLARVAAVVGRQDQFEEPQMEVSRSGRSSVMGIDITPAQLDDLRAAPSGLRNGAISGPVLLLGLNDSQVSEAGERLAPVVTGEIHRHSLGRRDIWHLGLRRGAEVIGPTVEWMTEHLD